MDVKLLKIITGDDVVSQIEEKEGEYTLKNPARIMLTQDGVAMMPWSPLAKENEKITIKDSSVMFVTEPEQELKNAYNEKYGSGIVTAGSGALGNIMGVTP